MCMYKEDKGFTLLETTISLAVFMVVLLSAVQILVFAANNSSRQYVKQELLENARIGLDFMTAHIKASEEIKIDTVNDEGRLGELHVKVFLDSKTSHLYEFEYCGDHPPNPVKYHRLEFGGNELASYIADVQIRVDDNMMTIKMITDDRLEPGSQLRVEPVVLIKKMNIKYKKIVETG